MIINFVGNYQTGYVGEVADEVHLADSMESLGHTVRRIPRDAWREYVIEGFPKGKYDVPEELRADINIIAKWNHFYDGSFIDNLRMISEAPVFYWVWDYMYDQGFPDWHINAAQTANLYLSGEAGIFPEYIKKGVKPYYFQMDICDGKLPVFDYKEEDKIYDVVFFGSKLGQGDRVSWLKEINEKVKVKIFAWNHEDWIKEGFDAEPAVYGKEFNERVAQSKVILGFSVNPSCWGYWSNRVGKVTVAGGFLLQQYAPGMELFLTSNVDYFNTPGEAVDKIYYYLSPEGVTYREKGIKVSKKYANRFTSLYKCAQLTVLIERYLKGRPELWNILP